MESYLPIIFGLVPWLLLLLRAARPLRRQRRGEDKKRKYQNIISKEVKEQLWFEGSMFN